MRYRKPPTKQQLAKARAAAAKRAYEGQYARVLLNLLAGLNANPNPPKLSDIYVAAKAATNHLKAECPSLFVGDCCGYVSAPSYGGADTLLGAAAE